MKTTARRAALGITGALALATTLFTAASPNGTAQAIVGGVPMSPSIYPAYVRVHSAGFLCGGTVIAQDTVLTAAHCVDGGVTPDQVTARVRDVTLRQATGLLVHPLWNGDLSDGHDLAIVWLTPGSTNGVAPVQVGSPWDASYYAANFPATIVGHGRTHWEGQSTTELRAVDTVLRSDDWMDDIYNPWYWFDHWNSGLAIGAGDSSKTACKGDSGGPLFVDKDGTWTWIQVGVASFVSDGCDEAAGFTELSNAQLAWVAHHVPAVKTGWGPCITPYGNEGYTSAQYVSWFLPTAAQDGPYYWHITCYAGTSPGGPTPTTRPPGSTVPPICERNPRKCPDPGP